MDNICHTLVGIAVAQTGLQRKTAFATTAAAISANLPDIDVLVFATDVPAVAFRRGITHGVPAQILLPIAFAGLVWWIGSRSASANPARFGWLLAIAYIGVISHGLLDLLNTYGIRLLSPLSDRWFYGDSVFIIDPWLWLILGTGTLLARRAARHRAEPAPRLRCGGRSRAAIALGCATVYIAVMVASARVARARVHDAWVGRSGQPPGGFMVGPRPVTPFRKQVIIDAGDHYVTGSFDWLGTRIVFDPSTVPKNDRQPAVAAAHAYRDVRAFLLWSRFPFWETADTPHGTLVSVRDMRFRELVGRAGFVVTVVVPNTTD